ncbi:MAG: tRNA pseudouridine(38-40) synthase TruA [Saprospiraceae bacterium]
MRYFINSAYGGTKYSGWQRQINTQRTIQEIMERVFLKIFKKKITVYGCGRTDAGVHASQYVFHVNLEEAPDFDLKFRLYKNLPDDIAVFQVIEVSADQHCRYDATARTYDYFIHWKKDPILFRYSSFYQFPDLDFAAMRKATQVILATQDFKPLCREPKAYKSTLCQVTRCELFVNEEQGRLRFSITSNRFLRGMIRYAVSFLLEVGRGQMTLAAFEKIMQQEVEFDNKRPAYPNGLFLSRIEYPFVQLENPQYLIGMLKSGLE